MLPIPIKKPGFHSERSPSSAHRWRLCEGSVEEERGLPDEVGEEAIQGTVFHDFAADCLELGLEPMHFIGDRMWVDDADGEREFTAEMANKMVPGLDLVWAMADVPEAKLFVEKRVNLENWIGPDESGTADAFIIDVTNWRLVCFDWKWGAGVPVQPDWNDQAMLYSLGVWDTYAYDDFESWAWAKAEQHGQVLEDDWWHDIEVVIIIEQPRAPGGGGIWTTDMKTLIAEGRKIREDADKTQVPGAPRTPGEKQCKFCKAARRNTCKARAEMIAELTDLRLDELETDLACGLEPDLRDRRALTPEQRSQILLHQKLITDWLKQLHEEAMSDAEKGHETPGMKRVSGRSSARKWRDEKRAEIMLSHDFGDEAWTKKLRSPAQIEEEVGKKAYRERYESNAVMGEAKPILVPESDPREALPSEESLLDELWDEPDETDSLL